MLETESCGKMWRIKMKLKKVISLPNCPKWLKAKGIENGENTVIVMPNGRAVWERGTWEDSTWKNGVWKNGTWKRGIWKYGVWVNSIWEDDTVA